jgi:hypothetical protein
LPSQCHFSIAMAQLRCTTANEQERERLMQEREQLLTMQAIFSAQQQHACIQHMGIVARAAQAFTPPPGLTPLAPAKTRSLGARRKQVSLAENIRDDVSTRSGSVMSVESASITNTVVMRNIPNRFSHSTLAAVLDNNGFYGEYDLIYVPMDFATGVSYGYAFVNLTSANAVSEFVACFDGFSDWGGPSKKVCKVVPCDSNESVEERVERYRNLRAMHPSVPDAFKPVLYSGGQRVPFPAPTKQIRQPSFRSSGQKE